MNSNLWGLSATVASAEDSFLLWIYENPAEQLLTTLGGSF